MRFSRSNLLDQLTGSSAPTVALLEAPSGYGKSWLLRRAWGSGALRLRGELGPLTDQDFRHDGRIVIDDAHRLSDEDIERLVEYIEFADDDLRLFAAGRLLPDLLHDVVRLVDGLVLDASSLALRPRELTNEVEHIDASTGERLVETAGGCVRTIANALEQSGRRPNGDPVAFATRIVRGNAAAALQHLDRLDRAIIGALTRSPGIDRHLIETIAGSGGIERLLQADVPLMRSSMGGFELAASHGWRGAQIDQELAIQLSDALLSRDRSVDAIELLLDAGDPHEAARMMSGLNESSIDSLEPRAMLGTLGRLGAIVNRDPNLLLIRASATRAVGRLDDSFADIERAAALASDVTANLRRRIDVEAAGVRLDQGRIAEARQATQRALQDIESGEERTFALAHQILAHCDTTSNRPTDLQRAIESYRIAAAAWDACGETSRARACRRDMTTGALVPLGRYEEALHQLETLLADLDVSDTERAGIMYAEAMVYLNAGRIQTAEDRYKRVADHGIVHDNPRFVAAAAWGRALVASKKNDLDETKRWISTAENTALSHGDDVLGVPFLCDVVEMYGAMGNFGGANEYLRRLKTSASLYPDDIKRAEFILEARQGNLGDIDAQLDITMPQERWRVLLVSAHAVARSRDYERARELFRMAENELNALGIEDPSTVGEEREYNAIRQLLDFLQQDAVAQRAEHPSDDSGAQHDAGATDAGRISVMNGSVLLHRGQEAMTIPPGNPQRLVGVVVAHEGSVSFDELGEAMWPGEAIGTTRSRLRNVLLRLRRAVGDVVVRTSTGVQLSPDVTCDLFEFDRTSSDALGALRTDPDLAGRLAHSALEMTNGNLFADFQYEEWAAIARRGVESKLIGLYDFLSVQAEDDGDLSRAQSLAERALKLDRYKDSRYVRIAELLTLQDRTAAAVAVLDDAAAMAREIDESGSAAENVTRQRDAILRRAVD